MGASSVERNTDPAGVRPTERFVNLADRVRYAMGTPLNIVIWIIVVGAWFALGPFLATHPSWPGWFTSNNFNFPSTP